MNRHKRKRERLKRVSVVHSQLCDQSRLCRISNNAATPTSKLPISLSLSLSLSLSHSLIHSVSLFLSYTLSLSHTLPLSLIHSISLSFCQTDFTMREGHTHNIEFQTLQSSPSHFQSPPSVVLSLSLSPSNPITHTLLFFL